MEFDAALYALSQCLADARCARDGGEERRAELLFTAAERFALRSGYLELLRLVWAHDDRAPAPKRITRRPNDGALRSASRAGGQTHRSLVDRQTNPRELPRE